MAISRRDNGPPMPLQPAPKRRTDSMLIIGEPCHPPCGGGIRGIAHQSRCRPVLEIIEEALFRNHFGIEDRVGDAKTLPQLAHLCRTAPRGQCLEAAGGGRSGARFIA